jgi:hypothetical protein
MGNEKFDSWAILELMGHRRLAVKVMETNIAGGVFLRIDIPGKDSKYTSQFYSPASIYCITPTTEEIARAVAVNNQPEPAYKWEFPQLVMRKEVDPQEEIEV